MTTQKVLIIDDHPLFRDALETALSLASGANAKAVHAGSIKDALERQHEGPFNLVLLDLNLADASGFDGLARLQSDGISCPIVVVSATEADRIFSNQRHLALQDTSPKVLDWRILRLRSQRSWTAGNGSPTLKRLRQVMKIARSALRA